MSDIKFFFNLAGNTLCNIFSGKKGNHLAAITTNSRSFYCCGLKSGQYMLKFFHNEKRHQNIVAITA
jgi:hypothetical protein